MTINNKLIAIKERYDQINTKLSGENSLKSEEEEDFEAYEISDKNDVGFGRRYDVKGEDIDQSVSYTHLNQKTKS